ncbi:helix-turn-helix domain-containing protein [Nocardioides pacificus]
MREWITYDEAAEVLGCSRPVVARLLEEGRLEQRKGLARKFPSINAASARRLAGELAAEDAERVEAERVRQEQRAAWMTPPADGQVWLDAPVVAALLSVSIQRVYQLLRAGRIPYTVHGGKHWIRRVDAEVIAAARAFHQRAQEARSRGADSATAEGSR